MLLPEAADLLSEVGAMPHVIRNVLRIISAIGKWTQLCPGRNVEAALRELHQCAFVVEFGVSQ